MSILKTKIKETLLEERKRKLEESFSHLNDISDKDFFVQSYVSTSFKLMNEGYNLDEIENYVNENIDYDKYLQDFKNLDFKEVIGGSMMSMVKEYIINFILTEIFGANRDFAASASVVFADYNPLDLLKIFKDEASCNSTVPSLSDALMEAVGRYIGGEVAGTNSRTNYGLNTTGLATGIAGNVFGEVIKESSLGETISRKFCKLIH